jgi:hypothetical protein
MYNMLNPSPWNGVISSFEKAKLKGKRKQLVAHSTRIQICRYIYTFYTHVRSFWKGGHIDSATLFIHHSSPSVYPDFLIQSVGALWFGYNVEMEAIILIRESNSMLKVYK